MNEIFHDWQLTIDNWQFQMSYFTFLFIFLGIPIMFLAGLAYWDRRRGRERPSALRAFPPLSTIGLLALIAILYTTPWDNYLVATRVWWYDPALVTGLTLGWVPIEEYTFFVLQPILGGLWLLFLTRRLKTRSLPALGSTLPLWGMAGVWVTAVLILLSGWQPGIYLALELAWALPPIALQIGFGMDILWQNRRLAFLSIAPMTFYLSAADALAIEAGTWTINPAQSLNWFLGGVLPVEEFLFFLLTNTLVVFGLVLIWAEVSHGRLRAIRRFLSRELESPS